MSPEDFSKIRQIFYEIFDSDWLTAYEVLASVGLEDSRTVGDVKSQIASLPDDQKGLDGLPLDESMIIDPLRDAKSFFEVYWQLFKFECAKPENRLYLKREQIIEILEDSLPCQSAWRDIVDKDHDFSLFDKMARHDVENERIARARKLKQERTVANLERLQAVERAVERNFVRSKNPDIPIDRIKMPFNQELEAVIAEMEAEGNFATPKEISEIITKLFPHIQRNLHVLLNGYIDRLKALKLKPKPKLAPTIYKKPDKPTQPDTVKIPGFQIDSATSSLIFNEMTFEFSHKGINKALAELRKITLYSAQEYNAEVKSLLEKLHEHCQRKGIIALFTQYIYLLHRYYNKQWRESDKKSEESLKIGLTSTTLGLKHTALVEDHIDPDKRPGSFMK